jgi:hypothetical protein
MVQQNHGSRLAMLRSTRQQASTSPKKAEPVTAILPAGELPNTCTLLDPAGSLLTTVMMDFAHRHDASRGNLLRANQAGLRGKEPPLMSQQKT